MIRLEFEAPYPPSTNNLYRTVIANGRPVRVKTGKAKEYGQAVGQRVGIALALAGATPQPPYALHLSVWMPDAARRDLSNTIKALEDAIFGVLHKDDSTVVELHAYKRGIDRKRPRIDVVLEGQGG